MLDKLIQDRPPNLREEREGYNVSDPMDEPPFPFLPEDYV
jgi:hypothetical protein